MPLLSNCLRPHQRTLGDTIMKTLPSCTLSTVVLLLVSCSLQAESRHDARASNLGGVINLTRAEAVEVGRLVWRNESAGSVDGLTAWNKGEDFASMGIGHFIWYPEGKRGPYHESFPELLEFLEERGVRLPASLRGRPACPWQTREAFMRDFRSPTMLEIRGFLESTVAEQAVFLALRLERSLPKMLAAAEPRNRERIRANFQRVAASPQGVYALIDYVNFKGEGTAPGERYNGAGWGLLQVLEGMKDDKSALAAFADSARAVLARRVENAPPARNEKRWLQGWFNRIETYRQH